MTKFHAFRTSIQVAQEFNKRHSNVIRDIKKLICSDNFSLTNFQEDFYIDKKGEKRPMYIMTQEGFSFLALAYRGKKASITREGIIENGITSNIKEEA